MKKITFYLSLTLLVTLFSTTVYADSVDFIEQCKNNYTYILADESVIVSGYDKLWEDRSLISEEDITKAESYNNENEEKMYYALKLRVKSLEPFMSVKSIDSNGHESITNIPNSAIASDASLSTICTDINYQAWSGIASADTNWYVVSIEKYDVCGNETLIASACDSVEEYNLTFSIPAKYSTSTDLRLAKIADGQVSYVDDIDSDATTYTISASGSAAYVFVGTRKEDGDSNTADMDILVTEEPTQESVNKTDSIVNDINDNTDKNSVDSGRVTAPQTGDVENPVILMLSILSSCLVLICCRKKCNE